MDTSHDHYDFGSYTLKYHLLDHMVGELRKFRTLSVFYSSTIGHINVQIKHSNGRTS